MAGEAFWIGAQGLVEDRIVKLKKVLEREKFLYAICKLKNEFAGCPTLQQFSLLKTPHFVVCFSFLNSPPLPFVV